MSVGDGAVRIFSKCGMELVFTIGGAKPLSMRANFSGLKRLVAPIAILRGGHPLNPLPGLARRRADEAVSATGGTRNIEGVREVDLRDGLGNC